MNSVLCDMTVSEAVGQITACYLKQMRQLLRYTTHRLLHVWHLWHLKAPVVFLSGNPRAGQSLQASI